MQRALAGTLIALWIVGLTGCGGELTQEDMMRNAIRRPSTDEVTNTDTPLPLGSTDSSAAPANSSGERNTAPNDLSFGSALPSPVVVPSAANTPSSVTPTTADSLAPSTGQTVGPLTSPVPPAASMAATSEQRRERSAENITRISQALQAYVAKQGMYPPPALHGPSRMPVLSWRVALLPYLGRAELYNRFKLDQPWDSPHNRPLLQEIPEVYQAPHRPDERTNYLAPTGRYMAFSRSTGELLSNFEDGVGSTVVLLEVDDAYAVPWTKPEDYAADGNDPKAGLGKLHETFFLVAWGDGTVYEIPGTTSASTVLAMLTIDGGEPLNRHTVGGPPGTMAAAGQHNPSPGIRSPSVLVPASTASYLPQQGRPTMDVESGDEPAREYPLVRLPVPGAGEQKRARDTFREIYQARYSAASTPSERRMFAQELMKTLEDVREDSAGLCVLLQIIRDIAAGTGDIALALEASDSLTRNFELDPIDEQSDTLEKLAETAISSADQKLIVNAALPILEEAVSEERYGDSVRLARMAATAARRAQDRALLHRTSYLQAQIEDLRSAYQASENALKILEDQPDDSAARYALGKYLCIYKGDWENGLPILAQSSNTLLRTLAQRELEEPDEVDTQVALGDAWWRAAQDADPGDQPGMYGRALHWYKLALPQLPAGLTKVKILQRLKSASQSAGTLSTVSATN